MRRRDLAVWVVAAAVLGGAVPPSDGAPVTYQRVSGTKTFEPVETAVSGNGRYVAFVASPGPYGPSAENPTGQPGTSDSKQVYVKDLKTGGEPELISVSTRNTPGNFDSANPSLSADGRYVVFASQADNLVPGDVNLSHYTGAQYLYGWDVFVRDRKLRRTTRISLDVRGRQLGPGSGDSYANSMYPVISADGSTIAYYSTANVLARPGFANPNGFMALYAVPRTGVPKKAKAVLLKEDGYPLLLSTTYEGVRRPAISANGRYVVAVDDNFRGKVFLRDLRGNSVRQLTSEPPFVSQATGMQVRNTGNVAVDGAGSKVVVEQIVTSLSDEYARRLVLWNVRTGAVQQVDGGQLTVADSTGTSGDKSEAVGASAFGPALSGNGRYLVFTRADQAYQSPYAPKGSLRGRTRVYLRDLLLGSPPVEVAPCDPQQLLACGLSSAPSISDNGGVIAFVATGTLDSTDPDGSPSATSDPNRLRVPDDVYVRT